MSTRLDLIKFTELNGKRVSQYGLQEVSPTGELVNLYDNEADQVSRFPQAKWRFVRTLGTVSDPDDFWSLVGDAPEIHPVEP